MCKYILQRDNSFKKVSQPLVNDENAASQKEAFPEIVESWYFPLRSPWVQ